MKYFGEPPGEASIHCLHGVLVILPHDDQSNRKTLKWPYISLFWLIYNSYMEDTSCMKNVAALILIWTKTGLDAVAQACNTSY
jgi:hypothetical protein